jgi:hypothetical protein
VGPEGFEPSTNGLRGARPGKVVINQPLATLAASLPRPVPAQSWHSQRERVTTAAQPSNWLGAAHVFGVGARTQAPGKSRGMQVCILRAGMPLGHPCTPRICPGIYPSFEVPRQAPATSVSSPLVTSSMVATRTGHSDSTRCCHSPLRRGCQRFSEGVVSSGQFRSSATGTCGGSRARCPVSSGQPRYLP